MNSGREPVNPTAIESELLRIENDWPRVIREKDVEAIRRVEAEDGIFVYPDGNLGNREQDIKDIESGALSAESWEVTDLKVNVLDADAAVVSGRAIVKGGKYKRPDGKTMDISGQYRFIDTFARRNGQWKLVAGASVPVQEPPAASAGSSPATKAPAAPPPPSPKPTY
jgi:ketosteroid isomerase-like protein